MSKNRVSLADSIAELLTTIPSNIDEEYDTTAAKLPDSIDESDISDASEPNAPSKFRMRTAELLEDLDERYAGKKSSRRDLLHNNENIDEGLADEEDVSIYSDADDVEDDDKSGDVSVGSEEEDIMSGEDSANDSGDNIEMEHENVNLQELQKGQQANVEKGQCVRNQLSLWESLLEIRIELQKSLVAANKLPYGQVYEELKKSEDIANKVIETSTSFKRTLNRMLDLQLMLSEQYPETKSLFSRKSKKAKEGSGDDVLADDEEILSEDEQEVSIDGQSANVEVNDTDVESDNEPKQKMRKLEDFGYELERRHRNYIPYRNAVIQKWNDKTRLAVGKNTSQNIHSVTKQIDHILLDKSRLIKRTQLKRSQYKIIGENEPEPSNGDDDTAEEYNPHIFDDDDFYHHLLRELIEVKSADITDPTQLSRQWIQLQNLRSKMKRRVDTRATKGRKIRYTVYPKLVNFMAPIDDCTWTHAAKTELFGSLFGKK